MANASDVTSVDAVIATAKAITIASAFVIFVFIEAPQNTSHIHSKLELRIILSSVTLVENSYVSSALHSRCLEFSQKSELFTVYRIR
jgi:hypothetical protein